MMEADDVDLVLIEAGQKWGSREYLWWIERMRSCHHDGTNGRQPTFPLAAVVLTLIREDSEWPTKV